MVYRGAEQRGELDKRWGRIPEKEFARRYYEDPELNPICAKNYPNHPGIFARNCRQRYCLVGSAFLLSPSSF